jgi:hypothetical protein
VYLQGTSDSLTVTSLDGSDATSECTLLSADLSVADPTADEDWESGVPSGGQNAHQKVLCTAETGDWKVVVYTGNDLSDAEQACSGFQSYPWTYVKG